MEGSEPAEMFNLPFTHEYSSGLLFNQALLLIGILSPYLHQVFIRHFPGKASCFLSDTSL